MKLLKRGQPSLARRPKREIPKDLWTKCESCGELIYNKALGENLRVCSKCDFHFSLSAHERLSITIDEGTFEEWDADLVAVDPLNFQGPKSTYKEKLAEWEQARTDSRAGLVAYAQIAALASVLGGLPVQVSIKPDAEAGMLPGLVNDLLAIEAGG